jgi:hypothetical protein
VVDTGTPITAYDSAPGAMRDARAHVGSFQLYDSSSIQRLDVSNITLFDTPLRSVGLNAAAMPVGAVLGGDNLSLFAATFQYAGSPTLTLTEIINTCSCQLSDDCQALFPFVLEGGQEIIALGANLYNYPATRVVIDACLEPIADPLQEDQCCVGTSSNAGMPPCENGTAPGTLPNPPYQMTGVDVKVLVATGFPGFAIGAAAYDRLRGNGAAAAALAGSSDRLHLPDPPDDGPNGEGLPVAQVILGGGTAMRNGQNFPVSALALVSRELYFGPCAELGRNRRQRRTPALGQVLRPDEAACLQRPDTSMEPEVQGCVMQQSNTSVCDDANPMNAVAAVIEVQKPLATYVVDDVAPLFAGVNADVRPANATVEAIIGTELLQRLSTTVDYPNGRIIAHCVDPQCLTYPRLVQQNECGRNCTDASNIRQIECINAPAGCDLNNNLLGPTTRAGGVCPSLP